MPTDDVTRLIEANKLMAGVIDSLYGMLMQHIHADELDEKLLANIRTAGKIMKDYE